MGFLKSLALLGGLAVSALSGEPIVEKRQDEDYEFIVVGSGAGGGPVAARLALAGYKTLLIEAGTDQGSNPNYTVPAYQAKSTEDPAMSWDFFVRHYQNDTMQELDYKLTYSLPDGGEYTGLDPPAGATIKGILYPRSATLGGCTAHNALVFIYPDIADFEHVVNVTGDETWSADNMREYFIKLENNKYLTPGTYGHGFDGWLSVDVAPLTLALEDSQLFSEVDGGAIGLGNGTSLLTNYLDVLTGDANADSEIRDDTAGYYQIPITTDNGVRNGAREFILSVSNATNANGTQTYPLTVMLNTLVTKVLFDTSVSPPQATGVEYLQGEALYKADSRSSEAAPGTPGNVTASREIIVSGGSFNSPQILKLSGIGPAAELESFGIDVVADLPGVGYNLQDHYEVVVQGTVEDNFTVLDGCNFAFGGDGDPLPADDDPCYNTWAAGDGNDDRGTYASSGFAAAMFIKTTDSPEDFPYDYDVLGFGGPVNFRGYFPGYSYNATEYHNYWSWALLKSHPRNTGGSIVLASSDPTDVPVINFNYFNEGTGNYTADLVQISQAIETARDSFADQSDLTTEVLPGSHVQTQEAIFEYIATTAWGHHCSCTCAIGADDDPMAVLDSSFRVRNVTGLRVVDASVWPKIPGTFTAASTYVIAEKAAAVIISQQT